MFIYVTFCSSGVHVASFDDGSEAGLKMFAEELLDLWHNPIVNVHGFKYYVVLGSVSLVHSKIFLSYMLIGAILLLQ